MKIIDIINAALDRNARRTRDEYVRELKNLCLVRIWQTVEDTITFGDSPEDLFPLPSGDLAALEAPESRELSTLIDIAERVFGCTGITAEGLMYQIINSRPSNAGAGSVLAPLIDALDQDIRNGEIDEETIARRTLHLLRADRHIRLARV